MTPLLSVSDVAKLLNVSESLVYRLKDEGKLRYCRIGRGAVRFRPEDVQQYLNSCVVEVSFAPRKPVARRVASRHFSL
jgi:excisionase family DNA binding protein